MQNFVRQLRLIAVAIEVTALHFTTKLPINGTYILESALVTPENAAQYLFPEFHRSNNRTEIANPRRARDFQCPRPPGLFILLSIRIRVGLDLRLQPNPLTAQRILESGR